MDSARRKEITAAYGSALEHRHGTLGLESDLPYPKAVIRRALLQEYFADDVDDRTLDILGGGLMYLETFLPDDQAALVRKTNFGFEALKSAAVAVGNPEEVARHVDAALKDVAAGADPQDVLRRLDAVKPKGLAPGVDPIEVAQRLSDGKPGWDIMSERMHKAAAIVRVLRELRGSDESTAPITAALATRGTGQAGRGASVESGAPMGDARERGRMLLRLIRIFAAVWLAVAVTVLLFGWGIAAYMGGFARLQELAFSPANYFAVIVTLMPGLVLRELADRIERGQRPWGLIALFLVSLALVAALFGLTYEVYRERAGRDEFRRAVEARRIGRSIGARILGGSATMFQTQNFLITHVTRSLGKDGIPDVIRVGDSVTVKSKTIRVRHIFWHVDISGETTCAIAESEDDVPYGGRKAGRLWIHVTDCEPLFK